MLNPRLFVVVILLSGIFAGSLKAQANTQKPANGPTSFYGNSYDSHYYSSQPFVFGADYDFERMFTVWTHCGDMEGGDKVYKSYQMGEYPTTQPYESLRDDNNGCDAFDLSPGPNLQGGYYTFSKMTSMYSNYAGGFVFDQDLNLVVTLKSDGSKFLLITDKLMQGILIKRDL